MFNKNILNQTCIITKSVYEKERKLRWLYRDESINSRDSGWQISSEFDDEEYVNKAENWVLITIAELIKFEPMAENVVEMPIGTEIIYDDEKQALVNTATNEVIIKPYEPILQRAFVKNLDFLSEMSCDVKIVERLFDSNMFDIQSRKLNFLTGKVVFADPCYLIESEDLMDIMKEKISSGTYTVKIAMNKKKCEEIGKRVFAVKVVVTNEKVEKYEILKPEGREWQVVGIDTGLCGIADKASQEEFMNFYTKWKKENSNKNFYNDYLSQFFSENEDIGVWKSENTENEILMISTGFGDGIYNPICGYDKNGKLCNIVIMFITPDVLDIE